MRFFCAEAPAVARRIIALTPAASVVLPFFRFAVTNPSSENDDCHQHRWEPGGGGHDGGVNEGGGGGGGGWG